MVRGSLTIPGNYWNSSEKQRLSFWIGVLESHYREDVAEVMARNSSYPIPRRFEESAKMLAHASQKFPYGNAGPRGPRPVLASSRNIVLLSGARDENQARYWGELLADIYGGIDGLLLDLGLSNSNPYNWGFPFGHEDIRRGVVIPRDIDVYVASALGLLYGDGRIDKKQKYIVLSGRSQDFGFYRGIVPHAFENAFNLSQEKPYESDSYTLAPHALPRARDGNKPLSKNPRITFRSTALSNYLIHELDFPLGARRMHQRLPPSIKGLDVREKTEFLRYLIAASVTIDSKRLITRISDPSEGLLKDIGQLLADIGIYHANSISITPAGKTFTLVARKETTISMYMHELFYLNPPVFEEVSSGIHAAGLFNVTHRGVVSEALMPRTN